jgi:hypothetical protein
MDVRGRAILMPGKKMVLELEPQANAGQQPGTPPEPEVVIRQIADGTLLVHPSKATITARRIQMQSATSSVAFNSWLVPMVGGLVKLKPSCCSGF